MKKLVVMFLFLCMLLSLTGCRTNQAGNSSPVFSNLSFSESSSSSSAASVSTSVESSTEAQDHQITLELSFGKCSGIYSGEMLNGLPHGHGSFSYENPDGDVRTYTGQWVNGHENGQGEFLYGENHKYIGEFKNDFIINGKLYFKDVLVYEGEFTEGTILDGTGKMFDVSGNVVYSGTFNNGVPDEDTFKAATKSYDYSEYERNPQKHLYSIVAIKGRVIQSNEDGDYVSILLIDSDSNITFLNYIKISSDEPRILKGDNITAYCIFEGLYSYETVGNGYTTVPCATAYYIDIH